MVASKFSAAMSRGTSEGCVSGLSLSVLFRPIFWFLLKYRPKPRCGSLWQGRSQGRIGGGERVIWIENKNKNKTWVKVKRIHV